MAIDSFEGLLQEVSQYFNIDLEPDSNSSCLLRLKSGLQIQMEIDRSGKYFIIGSDLGMVPAGSFRIEFFKNALIENGKPGPHFGSFAYSEIADHFVIHEMIHLHNNLNGEKIAAILYRFIKKAEKWKQALENEEIPEVETSFESEAEGKPSPGMFGLQP